MTDDRAPDMGYWFTFDGAAYDAWKGGRPFTLPEIWREVRGVHGVTIYAPSGRVVLERAGSLSARWEHTHRARRIRARAAWPSPELVRLTERFRGAHPYNVPALRAELAP